MEGIKLLLLSCFIAVSTMCFSQESLNAVRNKAASGDAEAQYYLGWCYFNGKNGVSIDGKQAVSWLEKSAKQGYEPAQYFMGWCYYYGNGVAEDKGMAYYWYQRAADKGNDEAAKMVALLEKSDFKSLANISVKSVDNFDASRPPILEILNSSITFYDPNGNNAIDANERCFVKFKVKNIGKGDASNCVAKVFSADPIKGLELNPIYNLSIASNSTKQVEIPIYSDMNTEEDSVTLYVQVDEPHGFGTDPLAMTISTKKFEEPLLRIVDYAVTSDDGSNVLRKRNAFDLQVLLQNTKFGNANDVEVSLGLPENVILMSPDKLRETFNNIGGGETKSIIYPLIVNNNYAGTKIPITINVREKYGKYAESRTIDLNLNQALASNKIVIKEKENKQQDFIVKIASIGSDVDKNIPTSNVKNDNTFAVIIANEAYNKEAGVPFATNDGRVFSEYCKLSLGVPATNVHMVSNATLNDIRHEIKWLRDVISVYKGEARVIFYYAGHGIPDEKEKTAYLLPVDGYGSDVTTGYSLADLYVALGELPTKSVTVFLDACFSGAKREGDMLASARGVAIKVKSTEPKGNMVVFTAAQGDETAYPYKEQGHGMFTYYLLKNLQETKGNATLGELGDFVKTQVERQSVVVNGKLQTPTLIPSATVGDDWKNWKLK